MQLRQVQDIAYQLLPGAERQTTDIVIERDGVVRVRPPLKMTPQFFPNACGFTAIWRNGRI
jgi:hypothetical protein